jgi:hypothetical protein
VINSTTISITTNSSTPIINPIQFCNSLANSIQPFHNQLIIITAPFSPVNLQNTTN